MTNASKKTSSSKNENSHIFVFTLVSFQARRLLFIFKTHETNYIPLKLGLLFT